jgi:hypothetical protein
MRFITAFALTIGILLLVFLLGCTETTPPAYTTNQFIYKTTDLNLTKFDSSFYSNQFIYIKGNKLSAIDFNDVDLNIVFPFDDDSNYSLKTHDHNGWYYKRTDFNYLTFLTTDNDLEYRKIDNNIFVTDLNVNRDLNVGGNLLVDGNSFINIPHGGMYYGFEDSSTTMILATDVYSRMTFLQPSPMLAHNLGFSTTNDSNLVAEYAGTYLVNASANFIGANGKDYGFRIFLMDQNKDNCYQFISGTGNAQSLSINCFLTINKGDSFNFRATVENNPPSNIDIEKANLTVTRVGN